VLRCNRKIARHLRELDRHFLGLDANGIDLGQKWCHLLLNSVYGTDKPAHDDGDRDQRYRHYYKGNRDNDRGDRYPK